MLDKRYISSISDIMAISLLFLTILLSYGLIHTRGLQSDDFCMGWLAYRSSLIDGVLFWLENFNGRAFLAIIQQLMYKPSLFNDPLNGKWYIYHGLIVLVHFFNTFLLYCLLRRFALSIASVLFACLLFSIHPILMQAIMCLAVGYGYVLGTFLFLLGIYFFLSDNRQPALWKMGLLTIFFLLASLGIEQFVSLLMTLAFLNAFYLNRGSRFRHRYAPLIISCIIAMIMLSTHFILTTGTAQRMHRAHRAAIEMKPVTETLRTFLWRLNPWPSHSPFGSRFAAGLEFLKANFALTVGVLSAVLIAVLIFLRKSTWAINSSLSTARRKLAIVGVMICAGSIAPFALTGRYGMHPRALYLPLIGISIIGAVFLDKFFLKMKWLAGLKVVATGLCVLFVCLSIISNLGAQKFFADSWDMHKTVMASLIRDKPLIKEKRYIEIEGIPPAPIDEIRHFDTSWGFPCMAHWLLNDHLVSGWTNQMPSEERRDGQPIRYIYADSQLLLTDFHEQ